jgi:hypothetical protein
MAEACIPDLELRRMTEDLKIMENNLDKVGNRCYKKPPQLSKVAKNIRKSLSRFAEFTRG